jgi:UDP-glucose 4-epimerase
MKKVLVTGGCGYIGSHTIVDLLEHGFEVVSIDNLSNASEEVLEGIYQITGKRVRNYAVDLCDRDATLQVFSAHPDFAGIIHFAALKSVGESVEQPLRYYHNNINSLLNVLHCAREFGTPHFIFSSSCSVYGNTAALPVVEDTPFEPAQSPYGHTKQIGEEIIRSFSHVEPAMRFILLRYFNPAGAHPSALIGEAPSNPANNLVPAITETAIGKRAELTVFGDDYPTRDGSCIRDYIHVVDLAHAHTLALQYLIEQEPETRCDVFNLGIGQGVTVLEAVRAFEHVTGQQLNYRIGPRRPGDVVAVYADYAKAAEVLGWQPAYGIDDIMRTAWEWETVRTKE